MFLTEVKITVTFILRSKTRIRRNFFSAAPFSFDRHNMTLNDPRQSETTSYTPNATRLQVIRPFAPTSNPSQCKGSTTDPNRQAKTTCCKL